MKKIPLIKADLPALEEIEGPLREILANGRITNFGPYVSRFEEEAGRYLGTHVATLSSGTMSLIVALQGLGLQSGRKVVIPSFTFMATAQAVCYAGGVPVFAEIEDELNLSPEDLQDVLARHRDAEAVIPVHMYGLPCRTAELQRIVDEAARRNGHPIRLIFDAAHAFGSATDGKRVGASGDAEVFSLSVTKVLVSVEGGMVSSRSADLIERIRRMRNYGIEANYNAHWPGLNGKMSEFHAIIGLHNLRRLDNLLEERQRKAQRYLDLVRERTRFGAPPLPSGVTHTFKDLTILVPETRREAIMRFLSDHGIETRAYFSPPVHEQERFRRFADRPLPRTEALAKRVLTLPFFTSINDDEMQYVVDALAEAERTLR